MDYVTYTKSLQRERVFLKRGVEGGGHLKVICSFFQSRTEKKVFEPVIVSVTASPKFVV